ncbi:putative PWI domain-containing protein [Mycena indigotica]|uniref:Putative PWI domain-containing protein n=1 Tax=Mycena indigotica TaxID=2126181 RepID=A0A8H6SH68_9AGAR|nr:putative PWI domain-containing protein [Mycena indigotica]KAF7299391.1 putative PWI domain-containing protein [Mycena indigotica]
MADSGFFKGTSADQDRRFVDKEQKLLKSTKFPSNFGEKVDMRKVNLVVIQPWITKKIVELCGFEDDILINYTIELLEASPTPDPRKMQLSLQAFIAADAPKFMAALWTLLLEAQNEVTGVPRTFVEQKKEEMRKARENDGRVLDERDRRARPGLDEITDSRSGRGRGRGRGDWGGGRGRDSGWGARGRGGGPPPPRRRSYSASPPGRRRSPPPPRRRRSPSRDNDIHSSRSPPPQRRRRSRTPESDRSSRPPSRSPPPAKGNRRRPRSYSRSRCSPPPPRANRRDSRSPPARKRRISRDRRSNVSRSRSPPRRRSISPRARRYRSPSRSRSRSPRNRRDRSRTPQTRPGELKIKGQAEAERNTKSRWDEGEPNREPTPDLTKRENELKEKALRNKVIRTRKSSS